MEKGYEDLFQRNIGILNKKDQQKLRKSRIAIAGLGGVGGIQAVTLARTGIGAFNLADPEVYAISDINRQYGATVKTIGKKKADVMEKIIKEINPSSDIKKFYGIAADNLDNFLEESDLVIEAIEYFSLKNKVNLYRKAREKNLHVITSPIIGYGSSLLVFSPKGMAFEEFFEISKRKSDYGKKLIHAYPSYLKPDPYNAALKRERPLPSLCLSTNLSASLVAAESIFILLGKRKPTIVPEFIQVDHFLKKYIEK
jgi:molybdopterin/thiamine biosynthesis adenylyltransferase